MEKIFLNNFFKVRWGNSDPFVKVYELEGEVFRNIKNRKTFRYELDNQGFFVKIHRNLGWKEIFKNLLQFKKPVIGATNEYNALLKLKSLNVDTMTPAAYANRGWNPAKSESFLITEELCNVVSLEDYCQNWANEKVDFAEKRFLIKRVAHMAGTMHRAGINHRDCYICHFLYHKEEQKIFIIDLHRAEIRTHVPMHYLLKDVAGIWFSAMDCNLTKHDIYTFIKAYSGQSLRNELVHNRRFWKRVDLTARKLYKKVHG